LFAGLSLYVGLTIFFNRRGFKSSQMAVFSFLLLAEEDKFEPHPSIHPSIPGQTSQSILEDTLLIRGARFFFVRKTKQEKRKKKENKL
jgi:hypothetical protein